MSPVAAVLALVGGLALLVVGAELLVRGASSLARRLRVSELAIGLTVVAFGTSMPELIVNIVGSAEGRHEIVFGNVIGSNIFNILVILGIAGLIYPLAVQRNTVWKEIPFSLLAVVVLVGLVNDRWVRAVSSDALSRADGLVLLGLMAVFLVYTVRIAKIQSSDEFPVTLYGRWWTAGLVAAGLAMLFAGGRLAVDGAVGLARALAVSEKLIAVTVLAAGTSLPELATSAVAAWRRRCDIAVGNIVGSNIFNIFLILGVSGAIRAAPYDAAAFNVDAGVLAAATVLLFVTMFTGKKRKLDRWEAALFLAGYAGYVAYLMLTRPGPAA